MKRLAFRLSTSILTFIVGITVSILWASFHHPITKEAGRTRLVNLPAARISTGEQNTREATLTYRQGLYSNYDYAYSVRIPEGLVGFRSPAPMPDHGFGIELSKEADAQFWVDASYNGALWESFDDAIGDHLDYLKDKDVSEIKLVRRDSTQLSSLPAIHFVAHYKKSRTPMVQDVVLAFRKETDDAEIVYTINLKTPASRFSEDKKVMSELQKSFKLEPLP